MYNEALEIFSIYDKRAEVYALPMFFKNEALAIRAFDCAIVDGSMLFMCPEDYELRKLGYFWQDSGNIESCDILTVASAVEILAIRKEKINVEK